jgi:hypothetical protein
MRFGIDEMRHVCGFGRIHQDRAIRTDAHALTGQMQGQSARFSNPRLKMPAFPISIRTLSGKRSCRSDNPLVVRRKS